MVQYINFQGKKYPIRISYYAMKMFQKDSGIQVESLTSESDIEHYETLLYHALVAGAKVEGTEMNLEMEDMQWMLDESFMEFVNSMEYFFPEQSKKATGQGQGKSKVQTKGKK